MYHDPYLPDLARSLNARRAALAQSVRDLTDSPPLIALTVGRQLVTDLGPERAQHVAQGIFDEVGRASERQARDAFAAEALYSGDQPEDTTMVVWLVLGGSVLMLAVMAALLVRHASAAAIEQRDLYRVLGDAAPAYRVLQ